MEYSKTNDIDYLSYIYIPKSVTFIGGYLTHKKTIIIFDTSFWLDIYRNLPDTIKNLNDNFLIKIMLIQYEYVYNI